MVAAARMRVWHPPTHAELDHWHVEQALDWYDYAELWLAFPLGRVLDFGCGDGAFLQRLASRATERHGVDIDPECVAAAAARPGVIARRVAAHGPLPYASGTFDTVVALEVLEHVPDERRTLAELCRVLTVGGYLLLTTPHKGWLTWLDAGNFKFLLPRVHRWIHRRVLHESEYYEHRFGCARQAAEHLCGDFCICRPAWHRHYACGDVQRLVPPQLQIVAWSCYFPAYRALMSLALAVRVCSGGHWRGLLRATGTLRSWLSRQVGRGGDELVVLLRKAGVDE